MNPNVNELCKDPLFQLNLAIWLAQPQPLVHFYVFPLFYKSKLGINSIGRLLTLLPDIRLKVGEEKLDCQDATRPDLILETGGKRKVCVLECKASSFGSNSSTASQARTLLLISGPIISEVLGLGSRDQKEGILCYLSGSDQIEMMENTLRTLKKEIEDVNFESGDYGCFGIKPDQKVISLEYSDKIKRFLNLTENSPVEVLHFEEDTDPRPLYLIPYDPNIDQTKEEQELCRRILFDRILTHIISRVGSADIPSSMTFTTEELLNSATFGVYEIWEDNEAIKHIRKVVKDFLTNIKTSINEPLRECMKYESQRGWIVELKDRETYEELLKQLQKFKPETLDLSKKMEPTLFDNMEN